MKLPKELAEYADLQSAKNHVRLKPGEYYAADSDCIISTLLGSCVAACLYDPINKVIGMNHFLLSNGRYSREMPACISEAGRYGVHAMELLINRMLELGAQKRYMRAKVFGGATILTAQNGQETFACVGEVNCRFICEFLKNEQIPVTARDLGGPLGRVIVFSHSDFSVFARKIASTTKIRIAEQEKQYWQKRLAQQKAKSEKNVELW